MKRAPPGEGLCTEQAIADSTAEGLWPGATQRPGHQLPCTAASCGREALRQRALRRPFFLSACFALRRTPRPPARKNTLASAHTDGRRTNDATCGPQAWLTGSLHWGEYGAYAHRCGGPLSSRPLSPTPYNAAVPKGPAFSFLNYLVVWRPKITFFFASCGRLPTRFGAATYLSCRAGVFFINFFYFDLLENLRAGGTRH